LEQNNILRIMSLLAKGLRWYFSITNWNS